MTRPEQPTWHAEATFTGAASMSESELEVLVGPRGPADGARQVDDRLTLRFTVRAVTYDLAYQAMRERFANDLLWNLLVTKMLRGPVAFSIMDELAWQGQMNLDLGLPYDTPADRAGERVLDQIAKLPPATDEDRARWQGADRG